MAYQSLNPYDGKILKTYEELTDDQLATLVMSRPVVAQMDAAPAAAEEAEIPHPFFTQGGFVHTDWAALMEQHAVVPPSERHPDNG